MTEKTKAVAKTEKSEVMASADAETLAALAAAFPEESGFQRAFYDRLAFVSKDVTEKVGKGKDAKMEIITPAGMFSIQRPTDEKRANKDGKESIVWSNDELGDEIDAIILFKRNQLKYFDEANDSYVSSTVFDSAEEEVKLFQNGKEIAKGTKDQLKGMYAYKDENTGKQKSKLEDNAILFVLHGEDVLQLNLRGSSMYSFMDYRRKQVPNTVVTQMTSSEQENGSNRWNKIEFKALRPLTQEEAMLVGEKTRGIMSEIAAEKRHFSNDAGYTDVTASPKSGDSGFGEFEAHIAQ